MEDKGEVGLLARLWEFGVSVAVATDCDTQALSGFLNSVVALKDWFGRSCSQRTFVDEQQIIDEDRLLRMELAGSLRILMLNNCGKMDVLQASKAVESTLRLLVDAPLTSRSHSLDPMSSTLRGVFSLLISINKWGSNAPTAFSLAASGTSMHGNLAGLPTEGFGRIAEDLEGELRKYTSSRCAVAVPSSDQWLPAYSDQKHSAAMIASVLRCPKSHAPLLARSNSIMNGVGAPVFATVTEDEQGSDGMRFVNIWRFTETCTGRCNVVATSNTGEGVQWINGGAISRDLNIGAIFKSEICFTGFHGSRYREGTVELLALDTPNRRTEMVSQRQLDTVDRQGASLVAVGDMLISFGGMTNSGDSLLCSSYVLVGRLGGSWVQQHTGTKVGAGGRAPQARIGHSAWAMGQYMYLFGGVTTELKQHPVTRLPAIRLHVANDLWRLDTQTWMWEELQPLGLAPCPRSCAGVATNGSEVYIVGGRARAMPVPERFLLLADIWQFHAHDCCWVQVVPGEGQTRWMSGRSSPACAILPSGRLAVMGGERDAMASFGLDTCLVFTIKHCSPAAHLSKFLAPGQDIRSFDGIARVSGETALNATPATTARLRSFLDAPQKAVAFLTQHHELLAQGLMCPRMYERVFGSKSLMQDLFRRLFGTGVTYPVFDAISLERKGWEHVSTSRRSPFDICPRWLAFPCEAVVNLCSKQRWTAAKGLAHTIKCFSTMKAADMYFHMTLPTRAQPVDYMDINDPKCILEGIAPSSADLHSIKWTRTSFVDMRGEPGTHEGDLQVIMMATVGHMYACQVVDFHRAAKRAVTEWDLDMLSLALLPSLLLVTRDETPLDCVHCGASEMLPSKQSCAKRLKVCRGCRLVRYCTAQCQAAAWPGHKAFCRKYQRRKGNHQ